LSDRPNTDIVQLRGTQSAVEYLAQVLSGPSFGFSGVVGKAVQDVIQRRIDLMREDLVQDIASGRIQVTDAISADQLASYIFRLQRSAIEGCARRKLRLMSSYFFRHEASSEPKGAPFLDAASIIEQMSPDDLKCLAIFKAGMDAGIDFLKEGNDQGLWQQVDLLGLFRDHAEFQTATQSLVQFGFIHLVSGWGTLVAFAKPRLIDFLNNLSLGDIQPKSRSEESNE